MDTSTRSCTGPLAGRQQYTNYLKRKKLKHETNVIGSNRRP
jgi:hypothetical protein